MPFLDFSAPFTALGTKSLGLKVFLPFSTRSYNTTLKVKPMMPN